LVAADEARSPSPVSQFELRAGELNDTDMSEDFLIDIHKQHMNVPQPPLIPSAVLHEEMEHSALSPLREDHNLMAQTTPGESSTVPQS
jgi:hypothetical protein